MAAKVGRDSSDSHQIAALAAKNGAAASKGCSQPGAVRAQIEREMFYPAFLRRLGIWACTTRPRLNSYWQAWVYLSDIQLGWYVQICTSLKQLFMTGYFGSLAVRAGRWSCADLGGACGLKALPG
jgi:hypothetical protein